MGTTTPNTCPIQRRNHMTSRTTSKILSHTAEITNHLLFQPVTHRTAKNTRSSYSPMGHDPHAVSYGQCPSPNYYEPHAATSYPPRPTHMLSSPSLPPTSFQQQHVVSHPFHLTVLPPSKSLPPPLRNQPLQPHFDRKRIRIMTLGTKETYLSCEPRSTPVPMSLQMPLPEARRQQYALRLRPATCTT